MIIEAVTKGLALIGGPSTISEMAQLINKFKKYKVSKILIDGALFRKSIASFKIADAAILSTGASYSKNINKVVDDTTLLLEELMLDKVDDNIARILENENKSLIMNSKFNKTIINHNSILNNEETIREFLNKNSR
ncbi:MAG: hypothetical protein KAH16_03765, partial [Candidatus Izimaplasma sp.]|nr:hypothetical protein [Candidatus Izimaplasma bacterium]